MCHDTIDSKYADGGDLKQHPGGYQDDKYLLVNELRLQSKPYTLPRPPVPQSPDAQCPPKLSIIQMKALTTQPQQPCKQPHDPAARSRRLTPTNPLGTEKRLTCPYTSVIGSEAAKDEAGVSWCCTCIQATFAHQGGDEAGSSKSLRLQGSRGSPPAHITGSGTVIIVRCAD
jgi:hypothetical protein